jgi:CRISPR-associated endonuclease/helicase Cas3
MAVFAHSKNSAGHRQELQAHLQNVSILAANFAASIGASELARYAGLLHDIGKFNPAFQAYLMDAELHPSIKKRGPDHKGAGLVLANRLNLSPLAFLIMGHHGGLPSFAKLKEKLNECKDNSQVLEAIEAAKDIIPELCVAPANLIPTHISSEHEAELFIRLLFSALVDADFLDTEQHFTAGQVSRRNNGSSLSTLWQDFEVAQKKFSGCPLTTVNTIRNEVYQDCLKASELEPGFFRLTVPTGGGKTRSSLAFALRHAIKHELQHIIYAIPYTSITEQTATDFRMIFSDKQAVLEHHSGITTPDDPSNISPEEIWRRLASENWDAPLVVTTTVQLFESLMAYTTSKCRKLHNIAGSVIILDETQMLPTQLLRAILDILHQLVAHYGTTVVLCTATQPALHQRIEFPGLTGIREIIPSPGEFFAKLKRVHYLWPQQGEKWTWQQVADRIGEEQQVLTIVNTRKDALKVLDALKLPNELNDPSVLHLSTYLCGAHRRVVLQEVRRRLKAGEPCRLISTQVIEAGVDIDFPLVLRAIGPLDRIAQAAGRCNREGKLSAGLVIVFDPVEGGMPSGPYKIGTQTTRALLADSTIDLDDPSVYLDYFERFYRYLNLDEYEVQAVRKSFDYPKVAEIFRLITDDTTPVVVSYNVPGESGIVEYLLDGLQNRSIHTRDYLCSLQPYMVNLRPKELAYAQQHGLVVEILPGLWLWQGRYDAVRGIVSDSMPDPEIFVW